MQVSVDYLGYIKGALGVTQPEEIKLPEDSAVRDLLVLLAERHGEPFTKAIYEPGGSDLKGSFILTVNGLLLNQLRGIDTKLKEDDRVVLMPIVSGG